MTAGCQTSLGGLAVEQRDLFHIGADLPVGQINKAAFGAIGASKVARMSENECAQNVISRECSATVAFSAYAREVYPSVFQKNMVC
jgi:hypothetical protein